ncbi:MAG TPA: hypothetical protein DCP51_08285 [Clostridiales bacterium]|nr:hypothetical protein [Clostridiales bacterium]
MGDLYNGYNPCDKKDKKDECCCDIKIIVNCECEDKKWDPCCDGKKFDKKCEGCNVTIIVNCKKDKDFKDFKDC